jgi:hypothetical protein
MAATGESTGRSKEWSRGRPEAAPFSMLAKPCRAER